MPLGFELKNWCQFQIKNNFVNTFLFWLHYSFYTVVFPYQLKQTWKLKHSLAEVGERSLPRAQGVWFPAYLYYVSINLTTGTQKLHWAMQKFKAKICSFKISKIFISILAIRVPRKKFNSETLPAIYEGKVMTMVMFGTVKYWQIKNIICFNCFFDLGFLYCMCLLLYTCFSEKINSWFFLP